MSSEIQQQKQSFGSTIAGYMAFPAITTTGSTIMSVKAHGGIKKAFNAQNKDSFKAINDKLGKQTDVFTRSQALSETYDKYKSVSRTASRSQRQLDRLNKGKNTTLSQRFLNLFKKSDEKINLANKENAKKILEENTKKLEKINKQLTNAGIDLSGKNAKVLDEALSPERLKLEKAIEKSATEVIETGAKANLKNFAKTAGDNFKHELGWKSGKFNYFMTALQFIPNIFQKVVPAFKNNGFKAGMTELTQTVVQAGADLVSYAAGGAVGRTIGTVIGTLICPGAGSAIGGTLGDMVGSMIVGGSVCGAVEKITNKDDAKNTGIPQESDQIAQLNTPQEQASQKATHRLDVDNKNLTPEQVEQLAYAQAFPKVASEMNGYYA